MTTYFNVIVPRHQPNGMLSIPDSAWMPLARMLHTFDADLVVRQLPAKSLETATPAYWIMAVVQGDTSHGLQRAIVSAMDQEIERLKNTYTHVNTIPRGH